jgi:predicted amidohydrolase
MLHFSKRRGKGQTMSYKSFTVALAQIYPRLADLEHNISLHIKHAEEALKLGADLVVFPELSLTGYTLKDLTADFAINITHKERFGRLFEISKQIDIAFGFVEESNYIFYNSAAYLSGGEAQHVHRKVYLPTYGMFDEDRYFSPGNTFRAFNTKFGRFAILVCEDYWHPSSVYIAAQDNALYHLYMANAPIRGLTLPDEITSVSIAENVARVSSQLYGVYSIYANRVGFEDGVAFGGNSRVVSPTGSTVAQANSQDEELVLAEVEPEQIRRARTFFPLMGDEKLDLVYRELTRLRTNSNESEDRRDE